MGISKVELANRLAAEVDRAEARGDEVSQEFWQRALEAQVASMTAEDFEADYR